MHLACIEIVLFHRQRQVKLIALHRNIFLKLLYNLNINGNTKLNIQKWALKLFSAPLSLCSLSRAEKRAFKIHLQLIEPKQFVYFAIFLALARDA